MLRIKKVNSYRSIGKIIYILLDLIRESNKRTIRNKGTASSLLCYMQKTREAKRTFYDYVERYYI